MRKRSTGGLCRMSTVKEEHSQLAVKNQLFHGLRNCEKKQQEATTMFVCLGYLRSSLASAQHGASDF